jgi:hypothetical protein
MSIFSIEPTICPELIHPQPQNNVGSGNVDLQHISSNLITKIGGGGQSLEIQKV